MSYSNSDGSGTSKPQLTPAQMLQLYNQMLPTITNTATGTSSVGANNIAQGAASSNPIYTQSGLDQLLQFAPQYQDIGADLAQQQAGSTADLLNGEGARVVEAANRLTASANPVQDLTNQKTTELLNSVNLNGLTGGEEAAIERSLNQSNYATGNLGLDNATNAVSNAMAFGNGLADKQQRLTGAISAGNAVGAQNNAVFNPVSTALNAGNTSSNFGLGTFNPTQGNATATQPLSFASSLGAQVAGLSAASKSKNQSNSDGGGCCFIVLEMYHGDMPSYVRKCRDRYYTAIPQVAAGYVRMAKWLVPLMRRSMFVRSFVWHTMVKPLTDYGAFITRRSSVRSGRMARTFWFSLWKQLGK